MAAARGLISMPRNWCGSTVRPKPSKAAWRLAEAAERVPDLALEPLHVFEGDVQEVPRPACRVEDGRVAQPAEEVPDLIPGLGELPLVGQGHGGGLDVRPTPRAAAR